MGCINSKNSRPDLPVIHSSSRIAPGRSASSSRSHYRCAFNNTREEEKDEDLVQRPNGYVNYSGNLNALRKSTQKKSALSFKFNRLKEGEQIAAGWPPWLSAVAGEAIEGWVPLKSDRFERLEKIGQGTYSDVYRARDLQTSTIITVKKVRFDNLHPESVRFMAREILILRKLDHPNVIKLEGIITSRLSCHIYLVFEYMEHDLAGLLSSPEVKFTESQIKCCMIQLLSGLEHCHSRGILHRDIKTSNILLNNNGILKIADFGLANFMMPFNKDPLTSRVVTLWYRPPELLLGSTSYGECVDLWSVGCVFAELYLRRPLLKGRNEVEQLHKIFRLCGSPPEDYWSRARLPFSNMFKPQQSYESTIQEKCKELPNSAVTLIETFLSIETHRRGTASSALSSKYFNTKPYACELSTWPKYAPSKEMDARIREARRKNGVNRNTGSKTTRKALPEPSEFIEDCVSNHRPFTTNARNKTDQTTRESKTVLALSDIGASENGNKEIKNEVVKRILCWEQEQEEIHEGDTLVTLDEYGHKEAYIQEKGKKKKKGRVTFSGPMIYPSSQEQTSNDQPIRVHQRSRFYKDSS